jgi:hypothetical protein
MASFLSWAESKDPVIYQYIEKVFVQRSHPEHACRFCGGIQRLGKIYGTERLKPACLRAISFEQYGYNILESILKQNLISRVRNKMSCSCHYMRTYGALLIIAKNNRNKYEHSTNIRKNEKPAPTGNAAGLQQQY